jgi:hypothetical protein
MRWAGHVAGMAEKYIKILVRKCVGKKLGRHRYIYRRIILRYI